MHTIKAISCFSYNGYIKHFFVSSTSATLKRQAAKHTSTTKRLRYLKPQGPRLVQRYDSFPFQQQKKRVSTPFRRIQNSLFFNKKNTFCSFSPLSIKYFSHAPTDDSFFLFSKWRFLLCSCVTLYLMRHTTSADKFFKIKSRWQSCVVNTGLN